MGFLCGFVHLVEGTGQETVADGFVGVFDKALVEEEPRKRSGLRLSTGAMPLKLSIAWELGKSSRREPNAARSRAL